MKSIFYLFIFLFVGATQAQSWIDKTCSIEEQITATDIEMR
jgi:hypothetical protein